MEDYKDNFSYDEEYADTIVYSLSDKVFLLNIENEIKGTSIGRTNLIENIFEKVNISLKNISNDNVEARDTLNQAKEDLIKNIFEMLESILGVHVELKEYYTRKDKIIEEIYNFFVTRKLINLENLIYSFIKREKKSLINRFKLNINKKDLTYVNNKKNLDKDKIAIILNLNEIISMVNLDDTDEIIDMIVESDKEEITNSIIKDLTITEEVTFMENFIENIKDSINNNKNVIIFDLERMIKRDDNF